MATSLRASVRTETRRLKILEFLPLFGGQILGPRITRIRGRKDPAPHLYEDRLITLSGRDKQKIIVSIRMHGTQKNQHKNIVPAK